MGKSGLRLSRAFVDVNQRLWTHIRIVVALSLALILGTSLTLVAQDTDEAATSVKPKTVLLRVDGTEREVGTIKETVQTLLHQEFICLNEHDRCEPPLSAPIQDGMVVTITRVTFEKVTEKIEIAPPTVTRWDNRMTVHPVVLREGKPGVALQTKGIWKKDGVVTEEYVSGTRVIQKPVPTVVVRGRQPSRAGVTGRKTLTMVATAYDPGPESCGKYASGYTAIGLKATKGVIAVDPRVIPLGSRVYVEGYGSAIAGDVGGAIKGNRIDVCFPTRKEALQWGRRTVKVVILQ